MAELTFKANLLPSSDLGKALGSSDQRWNIYGELNGNAATATKATQDKNGLQIDTGYLKLTGGTVTGTLVLSKITDASGTADNKPALIIGGASTDTHIEIDSNEIIAKSDGTTPSILNLQDTTGTVNINGSEGLIVPNGSIKVGTHGDTTDERDLDVRSGAGMIRLYSHAATTGSRGLWVAAHGTGTARGIIAVDTNNGISMTTNSLYVNTGTNPDGNTQGHGVQIIHNNEGGNIIIYAGKSGITDNWRWEIDAYNGWLRAYCSKNGTYVSTPIQIRNNGVYGAVWNDYAEFRKDNPKEQQEPGKCVREVGDGTLALTTKRLERGCEIISDTFGFAIGQDEENGYNTPIASNGRVLAYPYESIKEFSKHIGWPVCSGPNGTVSIMTEEEEEKYSSRIIGTISEIPSYEEWGTGKVKVNGRVWIRIK